MTEYTIEECNNSDYMRISRAITDYNLQHLPTTAAKNLCTLAYVLREEKKLVGGISARMLLGQNISIDILWVAKEYRNKKYGSKLLEYLENEAKKIGSRLSIVDTFDFQALDFYLKQGYTVFGELKDSPYPGNIRYYLSKKI